MTVFVSSLYVLHRILNFQHILLENMVYVALST